MRRPVMLVALVAALVLTGCSSAPADGLTLAKTKSPTQLLRNEATERIPPGTVQEYGEQIDTSIACGEDDPKELQRSWESSILVTIEAGSAWRVKTIGKDLVQSFLDDGWYISGSKNGKDKTVVTRPESPSTIAVVVAEGDESGAGASIGVTATGPCVLTDGPDSDEVRKLEAQD